MITLVGLGLVLVGMTVHAAKSPTGVNWVEQSRPAVLTVAVLAHRTDAEPRDASSPCYGANAIDASTGEHRKSTPTGV